jgi:hypothetical protein
MCSLLRTSALFGWLCLVSNLAFAHSFDERYDLPLPLNFFVWGGGLVVGLSFVLMIVASRRALPIADATKTIDIKQGFFVIVLRAMSLLLFSLSIAAALWGTGNPLMNLAPSFIWIIWWIGLSLVVTAVGNIWPLLDPWRTLFDLLNGAARVLGMKHGIAQSNLAKSAGAVSSVVLFAHVELARGRQSHCLSSLQIRLCHASVDSHPAAGHDDFWSRCVAVPRGCVCGLLCHVGATGAIQI